MYIRELCPDCGSQLTTRGCNCKLPPLREVKPESLVITLEEGLALAEYINRWPDCDHQITLQLPGDGTRVWEIHSIGHGYKGHSGKMLSLPHAIEQADIALLADTDPNMNQEKLP